MVLSQMASIDIVTTGLRFPEGPVAMPDDASFVLENTKYCHGFYGASSMERLPTEIALTEQTKKFKEIGR